MARIDLDPELLRAALGWPDTVEIQSVWLDSIRQKVEIEVDGHEVREMEVASANYTAHDVKAIGARLRYCTFDGFTKVA